MAGLSAQQRKFADLILSGETQVNAHKLAGYRGKNDNARAASACEILKNPNVAEYMAAQVKAASEMAQIDLQWLIREAAEVYRAAKNDAAYGPAFVGIKELSILTGNRIEKQETTVVPHEERLAATREKLNERRPTAH